MPSAGAPAAARSSLDPLAHLVSRVASPPILAAAAVLLVALDSLQIPNIWLWSAFYLALVLGAPLLYLLALYSSGRVSDLDLSTREERLRPYLVAVAALILGAVLLHVGGAPPLLSDLANATAIAFALLFAITLYWKISAHAASAGTFAALAGLLVTLWSLIALTLALVPLVCWARVHLGRHTTMQTVAGALLGAAVLLAVFAGG
jgi:membrane-associated phospholipid phosphatase